MEATTEHGRALRARGVAPGRRRGKVLGGGSRRSRGEGTGEPRLQRTLGREGLGPGRSGRGRGE